MVSVAKVASIFVLLGITFIFGVSPIWLLKVMSSKMQNMSRVQYIVSLMNCFAGGVFLGTSILHLIQESMETVEESIDVDYPLAGVLIGVGFFMVLGLEHVIGLVSKDEESPFLEHGHDHSSDNTTEQPQNHEEQPKTTGMNGAENKAFSNNEDGSKIQPTSYRKIGETSFNAKEEATPQVETKQKKKVELDLSGDGRSRTTKRIRTLILVIALSIHMIFEGMAIGLQSTESSTWTLMAAISIHKVIVVFSVCLKMKEVIDKNWPIVLYILYLASVSPAGVAIGLGISESGSQGSAQEISSGILQSLAAGTFVYVTFFEILQKELTNGYSLLKVFLTLLGFGVMAALKLLDKD